MAFRFPRAGVFASAAVRQVIEAFRKRPLAERRETPLLYVLLGDGTPAYKFDPRDVVYVASTGGLVPGSGKDGPSTGAYVRGRTCSNCQSLYVHATTGVQICDQVQGEIASAGWCNRWRAPWSAAMYRKYQNGGRGLVET